MGAPKADTESWVFSSGFGVQRGHEEFMVEGQS